MTQRLGLITSMDALRKSVQSVESYRAIEDLSAAFQIIREHAREHHKAGGPPRITLLTNSFAADFLIGGLYHQAVTRYRSRFPGGFVEHALLAVGGYGRREMAPYSDIDLLFLVNSPDSAFLEALAESILYPLWDLGFKVGYAMRTPEEAISMGRRDSSIWTSMLDMRYLAGSTVFTEEFIERFQSVLMGRQVEGFLRDKWNELNERRQRAGSTVFLLEPNVKEGTGGLRDLHTIEWSIRCRDRVDADEWLRFLGDMAGYSTQEISRLRQAQGFLWRVRSELHYLAGRNADVLGLQIQDAVAGNLGIRATRTSTASEALMGRYYANARRIANITDELRSFFVSIPRHRRALYRMVRRTVGGQFFASGGQLSLRSGVDLVQQPEVAIRLLRVAAESDQELAFDTARRVDKLAGLRQSELFRSREVRQEFVGLFSSPRCGKALDLLHQYALLPQLMREFKHLWCRLQHDAYHSFTVDMHLITCVKVYERILAQIPERFPEGARAALKAVPDQAMIRMAILFHDIGKGYGRDHSEFGAQLVRSIGRRFDLDRETTSRIAHLVAIHLLLSNTAQRSDINDPEVVAQFCASVGDLENLHMLYLLTIVDQLSVSDSILTSWKFGLMDRLYTHALHTLESGDTRGQWIRRELAARRRAFKARAQQDNTLSPLPLSFADRYFMTWDAEQIDAHARFIQNAETTGSRVRIVAPERGDVGQVWIRAQDYRGLFRNTCAIMYQQRINILQIEAFVNREAGDAFNVYYIQPDDPLYLTTPEKCSRLQKALDAVLAGSSVTPEVGAVPARVSTWRQISNRTDKVFWDDQLVEGSVVVEVHTWDRLGLLYQLADVITRNGYTIFMARISTQGNRVYDIFYLRDGQGRKPSDHAALDELIRQLTQAVDGTEGGSGSDS